MELIPLLTLKKNKIYPGTIPTTITTTDLLQQIKSDTPVYFLDLDGINDDKPNLCLFQKLGSKLQLWTDSGPRVLGDIVDTLMAGAQHITLRPHLWTNKTIENIQEITDQKLYIHTETSDNTTFPHTADGIVLIPQESDPQLSFKQESHLKTLALKTPIYLYDPHKNNYAYWQKLGITGILINLDQYPEYISHVR